MCLLFASKFYNSSFPEVCKKCQTNRNPVDATDSTGLNAALANWYSIYIPIKAFKVYISEFLLTGAMQAALL